ncbi:MAG: hypothetical protein IJH47_07425 [Oscillospiraceae bacterium]|nr:hypothetical protein [Oscillospiraceae bacterium]
MDKWKRKGKRLNFEKSVERGKERTAFFTYYVDYFKKGIDIRRGRLI